MIISNRGRLLRSVDKALGILKTGDDLAKHVTEAKLRQMLRDGEWEAMTDIDPAISERRAIEVRVAKTNQRMWVRVT